MNPTNDSNGVVNHVETGKRLAAFAAVDENVRANMVVGVGSGSTIAYSVERLAEKVEKGMKGQVTPRIVLCNTQYSRQLIPVLVASPFHRVYV